MSSKPIPSNNERSPLWILPALFALWAVSYVFSAFINPAMIERAGQSEYVPAGWEWVDQVVGYVWFVLLSLMVGSRWLVVRSGAENASYVGWLIIGYIAFCFSYVLTFGLTPETGLLGNIVTILLSGWLGLKVAKLSLPAALPIWASTLWVSVASVYLAKMIRLVA